ncbi:hypothetical protein GSI_05484 [Ganoderma sinense ZZ0214-1]|uniref:Uncharacterized protein n=1 Tax=Ganoderma sinense ZZ0214-1 TaxID=1077348 RepID=A0A2G8SEP6_9APHY|nr:hypothetical protein GSI_05484 [Ganoderma sinense ZZ0214-1]
MPAVRTPVKFKEFQLKPIGGVVYAHDRRHSAPVQVPTIMHPTRDGRENARFPSFEAILGPGQMHECWVTCQDSTGRDHRFLIAAQYSEGADVNLALKRVLPEVEWRGGLIVMRGGCHVFVVGMGGSVYRALAEQAVRKYLIETAPLVIQAVQGGDELVLPTEL